MHTTSPKRSRAPERVYSQHALWFGSLVCAGALVVALSACAGRTVPGTIDTSDAGNDADDSDVTPLPDASGDDGDMADSTDDATDAPEGDTGAPDGDDTDATDATDSTDATDGAPLDAGDDTSLDVSPDGVDGVTTTQRPAVTSGGRETSSPRFRARVAIGGPVPGGAAVSPRFGAFFGISLP